MSPIIVDSATARLVSVSTADLEDRTAQIPAVIIPMPKIGVPESNSLPLLHS
jgi:hypothetical protein